MNNKTKSSRGKQSKSISGQASNRAHSVNQTGGVHHKNSVSLGGTGKPVSTRHHKQSSSSRHAALVHQTLQHPPAYPGNNSKGQIINQNMSTGPQQQFNTYVPNNQSSGKNMRSVSLTKRLAQAALEGAKQNNANQAFQNNIQFGDLNQTAIAQQQLNTLIANKRLMLQQEIAQHSSNGALVGRNSSQLAPATNRRPKHTKAYSIANTQRGPSMQAHPHSTTNQQAKQMHQNQSNMPFSGRQPVTEQYLNQPLQMNKQIMNGGEVFNQLQLNNTQTIPMPPFSDLQSPYDYQTIGLDSTQGGQQNFSFHGILSPKDQLLANHMRWADQKGHLEAGNSSYSFLQQANSQFGGQASLNQLSSKGSKGSNLNQTQPMAGTNQQTGRSFSHCSRKDFTSVSSGKHIAKPNIPEAQLLESEEHFESGKVFLGEKKYKEAIKEFSRTLSLNKISYDALFYRAVSYLDSNQPSKAISDLNELIELCPDYRKTMFIVLSIAYRRQNEYSGALRILSKALQRYPRYIEAYIARGQIYIFQKKWEKALCDFRAVIQLQPQNGLGYLGQGDSLKGIGNYNAALMSFSKAIEVDGKTISQGLMKRGLLLLQMKYSEQALQDFTKLTEIAEDSNQPPAAASKAYFYKAKALKKLNNLNDAILYFEQVIRANDDNHLASSALYEIAKIKIQQKDFYEAYHNLKRANHFKLKQKKLLNYKMFTEGVIFLMKRKTKTGLKLITSLIERMKPTPQQNQNDAPDYIYNLVFLYRAYGYFVTEEYENSLKDYIKANQVKKLNASALYNMYLTQGLKCLGVKEYENAISFFTKASQKLQSNRDPFLLRSIAIVRYALHKPIKPQTRTKMLKDAKRDLNKALKNSQKDWNVLYLRGLLNFALHYFFDAIADIEMVIEKSEEASAKHYLTRGRCYACLSMFKEAITDLSIAINLNKDCLDAFLNRGKCAYLIGDTGLAFMDFQKLIVIEPKNPMVHIYAGNLLMTTGSYEDATKAFTNADNIQKSSLALYQRARCNVALNGMNDALKDLNKVLETAASDKVAVADRECLNALKIASGGKGYPQSAKKQDHNQTEQSDKDNTSIGPLQPQEKTVYEKATTALTKLLAQENNEHLAKITHDSSIQHHHSQLIPSAQRTKTDKIRAIRRRKEQDRMVKEGHVKRNDLRFRVQHPNADEEDDEFEDISDLDPEEIAKLNKQLEQGSNATQGADISDEETLQKEAEDANYYKENIFNKEDYYLYRGVMNIYVGDYEKALSDLEQSSQIMHVNKVLYPKNQFPEDGESLDYGGHRNSDDANSNNSSQTDLSDVGLCSLNIHEYSFNSVICLICLKQYEKALDKMTYMFETMPKKYISQLWLIRGQIQQNLGNVAAAKKDFSRAQRVDKENAYKFLDAKQSVYLPVFPQQQRLCNSFAFVKTPLMIGQSAIYLRPSFSFPFIKPPNMIPCVENSVLDYFTPKAVPLKPEAPWIKKCSFGIKFTDEIYLTDDSRENTPDEEKEYKKKKQRQQERYADGFHNPRSNSEKVFLKNNIFNEASASKPQKVADQPEEYLQDQDHSSQYQKDGQEVVVVEDNQDVGSKDLFSRVQNIVQMKQSYQSQRTKEQSQIKTKESPKQESGSDYIDEEIDSEGEIQVEKEGEEGGQNSISESDQQYFADIKKGLK